MNFMNALNKKLNNDCLFGYCLDILVRMKINGQKAYVLSSLKKGYLLTNQGKVFTVYCCA